MQQFACHRCQTRTTGCHGTCEEYQRIRAERAAANDARFRENEERFHAVEMAAASIKRFTYGKRKIKGLT